MNFDYIAELVHELAENPNHATDIIARFKSSRKIGNSELDTILKVFSNEELSGNCLAIGVSPTLYWF